MDQAPEQSNDGSLSAAADAIESLLVVDNDEEETAEAVESTEEVLEETRETEEVEEATEEAETEEESEDAEPEEESEEPISLESFEDIVEALGIESDDLNNLTKTLKVNGEEISVSLKDAFDGYQKDADYRQKTSALAEEKRQFQEAASQHQEKANAELLQVGQFLQTAQQILVGKQDSEAMKQLQATDPARWSAERMKMQDDLNAVEQLRQNAANIYAQNQQAQNQAHAEELQKRMSSEGEQLLSIYPDWMNSREDGGSLKGDVDSYLMGEYGYTENDLGQVLDHRLVVLANKARLYDQSQKAEAKAKVDVVRKKVKTAPKLQKSTAPKKVNVQADKIRKAKSALKRSGRVEDAVPIFEQFV